MGKASRAKGAVGEREVGRLIAEAGFTGKRMGRNGLTAEDVEHDIPGVHLEVKRCETLSIPAWLRQAERDCPEGRVPWVVFRQSRQPWRVVVPLGWLLRLMKRSALLDAYIDCQREQRDDCRNHPGGRHYHGAGECWHLTLIEQAASDPVASIPEP